MTHKPFHNKTDKHMICNMVSNCSHYPLPCINMSLIKCDLFVFAISSTKSPLVTIAITLIVSRCLVAKSNVLNKHFHLNNSWKENIRIYEKCYHVPSWNYSETIVNVLQTFYQIRMNAKKTNPLEHKLWKKVSRINIMRPNYFVLFSPSTLAISLK